MMSTAEVVTVQHLVKRYGNMFVVTNVSLCDCALTLERRDIRAWPDASDPVAITDGRECRQRGSELRVDVPFRSVDSTGTGGRPLADGHVLLAEQRGG